jgi:hypothetical protein
MATEQPAPAPRQVTINVADLMRVEFFLLIAGFMVLIPGAAGRFVTAIIIAIMMFVSAALSFVRIPLLNKLIPATPVAFVCGAIVFIFALEAGSNARFGWELVLMLIGGLIAVLGAILDMVKGTLTRKA